MWELLEENQFPLGKTDLPEVAKFASLWTKKDAAHVHERKIFWVLMEASIHAASNRNPPLSPTIFKKLARYTEFKTDFHRVYIQVLKGPD